MRFHLLSVSRGCSLLIALAIVAGLSHQAQAGKYQRMAMQPTRGYSSCQLNGTCAVPQAQAPVTYYATGQGASYAPPTQAPVTEPANPSRVLTYPVAYQQTEPSSPPDAKVEMVSTPAESKRWIALSNYRGWEGLGVIGADGYVRPEKWRNAHTGEIQDTAPASAPQSYSVDPYGFTAWLNGVRAQYGLGAVGCDGNLCGWAAVNNDRQNAYGMGHHVMGSARRQNSGMGAAGTVWQMWMASPAHRAALLDPSISWIGIAASGAYWTFNAN